MFWKTTPNPSSILKIVCEFCKAGIWGPFQKVSQASGNSHMLQFPYSTHNELLSHTFCHPELFYTLSRGAVCVNRCYPTSLLVQSPPCVNGAHGEFWRIHLKRVGVLIMGLSGNWHENRRVQTSKGKEEGSLTGRKPQGPRLTGEAMRSGNFCQ